MEWQIFLTSLIVPASHMYCHSLAACLTVYLTDTYLVPNICQGHFYRSELNSLCLQICIMGEGDRMRMRIMSECMCIQTRTALQKEIQEVRECQGLRGERAVSGLLFFLNVYMGWSKKSSRGNKGVSHGHLEVNVAGRGTSRSEVSIYLDVQGATRRPVCLAHGKQVRGRVVGNEVVARERGGKIL